jgi:transposase
MYFRTSTIKGKTYLSLVESYREEGKVKQKLIASFGLLEDAISSGVLERMVKSAGRYLEKLTIFAAVKNEDVEPLKHKKIGAGLIFGHIWNKLGIDSAINELIKGRKYEFSMERVIFAAVLQRLVSPDSDRAGIKWLETNQFDGSDAIQLHHLYRAMKWIGSLPDEEATCLTSEDDVENQVTEVNDTKSAKRASCVRCNKDLLEEEIYSKRRDLFTQLDLVFFDTTSIYFEGAGGEQGTRGHSKDHRPDLNQVVVGMVIDNFGWPICTEFWPGNTADVTTLMLIAEKLKNRFNINNVCIVADRGMISKDTISQLLKMGWSYILGAKMRVEKELRTVLEDDSGEYEEVTPERSKSIDPAPLKVKEVVVNENKYILCVNEEEVRKDRYDRDNILTSLAVALKKGEKNLVGNRGFKRYLKSGKDVFEIDHEKAVEEQKYDGKFVLKTNLNLKPAEIALKYKQLLMVETIFRTTKSILNTRPVFHQTYEAIRGHLWCNFLALLLQKSLMTDLSKDQKEAELPVEWKDLISDLDLLTYSEFVIQGVRLELRSEAKPGVIRAFRALGKRLPDHIKLIKKIDLNKKDNINTIISENKENASS